MTRTASDRPPVDLRRVVTGVLPLVVAVAVLAYLLPQFADVSDVWQALRSMTWLEITTLLIAAAWNLVTYGLLMVCTTPGLTLRQAMVVTESSTAVANTLPGGGALGIAFTAAMLASWGFSRARTTVSLLVSGLWNNVAKLALPVLALAWLALRGDATPGRVAAAVAGVTGLLAIAFLLWAVLRSEASARRLGRSAEVLVSRLRSVLGRTPVTGWDRATTKFRARTVLLLQARWGRLTLVTLVSHLSLFLVLLLALRHVGVSEQEVATAEALAVFAFARLLTAVPITPGGVGVVEVALVTGLDAAGGGDAQVVAAVLAFRALTYVLPVPLGLLTYLYWRGSTAWRREPGQAPRTSLVPETR
ncbi:MAG: putative Phosphatidylglycerol lysyltransferase [Frankiales bacterium]|nr:putative Phosphatidylglycerol lysyltransferase [Frankiales bacterium]